MDNCNVFCISYSHSVIKDVKQIWNLKKIKVKNIKLLQVQGYLNLLIDWLGVLFSEAIYKAQPSLTLVKAQIIVSLDSTLS